MKKLLFGLLMVTGLFYACTKDKNEGEVTLKVLLTDNPLDADEVNVDVRQVRVKLTDDPNDDNGWINLETNAGIYNLLDLQNGVTTPLAEGPLPSRDVKEIRLVLGGANTIVVAGVEFPLTIPSGSESGLKIKINKQLRGAIDEIIVDFDAALSVHMTGNGQYMLKPVLKIK